PWTAVAAATAFRLQFIRQRRDGRRKKGGSCCYRSPRRLAQIHVKTRALNKILSLTLGSLSNKSPGRATRDRPRPSKMAKPGGEAVDNQIHRLLLIMSGVALCVISSLLLAQEAPKPASSGVTVGVVAGPRIGGVQRLPYSAEEATETTQTLADGTHITQKNLVKVYQDSQGRTRHESFRSPRGTEGQEDLPVMVNIFDPVAGV